MQIKNRIKGLAQLHHSRIQPCPKNWRTHGDRQRDVLRGLLADVGVVDAVLVRPLGDKPLRSLRHIKRGDAVGFADWLSAFDGDFMLVDGHLRVEELQQHGDGTIDVLVLDLDEREAAEVLALFDPVGDLAGMDKALFMANLEEFSSTNEAVMSMVSDLALSDGLGSLGGDDEDRDPNDDDDSDIEVNDMLDDGAVPEFFMSVRGPVPAQPDAIDALRNALERMPGVSVDIGIVGRAK